ncbi:hypothetical protein EDB89DRAFT_2176780 [Lactarius sanguifluus]|nr:hypothetical protein EDB89DRAFT_2176780 [Lactarius sanguifluus]
MESTQRMLVHPAARPSAAAVQGFSLASPRPGGEPPSGPDQRASSSATFQTPEADAIDQWFENFHHYAETAAASLDVNFTEELSAIESNGSRFFPMQGAQPLFIMARADPMTALLSTAVGGPMQSQMEAKLATPQTANHLPSTPLPLSSLDIANTIGESSNGHAFPTARQTQRRASNFCAGACLERRAWDLGWGPRPGRRAGQLPHKRYPSSPGHPVRRVPTFYVPPPALPSAPRAPMATPLLPMFKKTSSNNNNNNNNNNSQTVDLATAKLNDFWSNNGVTNNGVYGVYGDDGDLIRATMFLVLVVSKVALRIGGSGTWSGGQSPAPSNTSGCFSGSDDGSNPMAAAHQQAALAGLGMGLNGMNPFNMNMNMLNPAAMDVLPEAQLLVAQIAAAGGGFGQPGIGVDAGLGTFAFAAAPGGPEDARLGLGGGSASGKRGSAGNGGAKKDDEDFEPAVLNDVAGWLRTLRLHKYTPNFEGMTWKEMVMMDEQALEAQGVAALGARRKMLKTRGRAQEDGHR